MWVRNESSTKQEHRRRTAESWRDFVRGGEPTGVPPAIAASWSRCRDQHGVDPAQPGPRKRLDPAALAERRDSDEGFRVLAPILRDFTSRIDPTDHVVAYFDAEGVLLAVEGDPRVAARAAGAGLGPGAVWTEASAGTCACALALASGQACEVLGAEHAVEVLQPWSEAAAPVFVRGSAAPVGVVVLFGPWEVHWRQALQLTKTVARAVEERLAAAAAVREEVIRHTLRMAQQAGYAVVAVDTRGRVIAANDARARRRFMEAQAATPSVRSALLELLRGARTLPDGEVELELPGGEVLAVALVRHGGAAVGAVVRVAGAAGAKPWPRARARYDFDGILGRSAIFHRALELARGASGNDLSVVITGESGTGKELFAQAVHASSGRGRGPFVAVNCASIPSSLVEAELFGYEAGTFTGATREGKAGRFEDANGGTLFLDEVSELPLAAQGALLRVLQEREVVRLGGSLPRPVDVRVIAVTNRPLEQRIGAALFRRDLFYRLNVLRIGVPPLRDRGEDVALLADAFLEGAQLEVGRVGLGFAPEALARLRTHPWPGNVRELRNVILRAAATAPGEVIGAEDLVLEVLGPDPAPAGATGAPVPPAAPARPPRRARELTKQDFLDAIEACQGNFTRAASTLGISRMTLYRWAHKHGIPTQQRD